MEPEQLVPLPAPPRLVPPVSSERSVDPRVPRRPADHHPDRVPVDARRAGCRRPTRTSASSCPTPRWSCREGHRLRPGPRARRLVLQLKTRENGWQEVLHDTGPGGGYWVRAPDGVAPIACGCSLPHHAAREPSVSATRRVAGENALPAARAELGLDLAVPSRCPVGPVPDDRVPGQPSGGATPAQRRTSGARSSRSAGDGPPVRPSSAAPGGRSGATGWATTLPARTSSSTGSARRRRPAWPAGS